MINGYGFGKFSCKCCYPGWTSRGLKVNSEVKLPSWPFNFGNFQNTSGVSHKQHSSINSTHNHNSNTTPIQHLTTHKSHHHPGQTPRTNRADRASMTDLFEHPVAPQREEHNGATMHSRLWNQFTRETHYVYTRLITGKEIWWQKTDVLHWQLYLVLRALFFALMCQHLFKDSPSNKGNTFHPKYRECTQFTYNKQKLGSFHFQKVENPLFEVWSKAFFDAQGFPITPEDVRKGPQHFAITLGHATL